MAIQDEAAAFDAALIGMFRSLEARPAPEHILLVVDQLEASRLEAATPTPAPSSFPEP